MYNSIFSSFLIVIICLILHIIFGFVTLETTKAKGYSGGFAWGFWLGILGIIVVAVRPYFQKVELIEEIDQSNVNLFNEPLSFEEFLAKYDLLQYKQNFKDIGIISIDIFRAHDTTTLKTMVAEEDHWKIQNAVNLLEPGTYETIKGVKEAEPMDEAEHVKTVLTNNNLAAYIPLLEEHHLLDKELLATITREDFIEMGISIIGDRKKIQLLFPMK